MDMELRFETLHEGDIGKAARVCAEAMRNTSSYKDIYFNAGDEDWRVNELEWLFNANIYCNYHKNPSVLRAGYDTSKENEPQLVCFFMFVPSNIAAISLWEKIYAGLLMIPFRVGWNAMMRLLDADAFYQQQFRDLMQDRPYFELQRMVVLPAHQGKGLGSKALGLALDEADKLQMPVVLITDKPINVTFYQRLGFNVVREVDFTTTGNKGNEYHAWFMIREPK